MAAPEPEEIAASAVMTEASGEASTTNPANELGGTAPSGEAEAVDASPKMAATAEDSNESSTKNPVNQPEDTVTNGGAEVLNALPKMSPNNTPSPATDLPSPLFASDKKRGSSLASFHISSTRNLEISNSEKRKSSLIRGSDLGLLRQKSVLPVTSANPFVGTWSTIEGRYNQIKTLLLFPIAMIRLFICVLIALFLATWCSICLIGVKGPGEIGYIRRFVFINPMVRISCRIFLFVLGFYWIPVRGSYDKNAQVMIANHTTMVDVIVLLYCCAPSFLSKASVLNVPLVGQVCTAMQVVGVDRTSPADRERTKIDIKRHIEQKFSPPLLIFAEGTTSRYDTLLRFKPGAFEFSKPIQPVLLHWRWNFVDPSSCATTDVALWAFQILSQFYHYVEVEYLPIVTPNAEERSNPLFFMNNTRSIVHKGLNRRSLLKTPWTPGFVHEVQAVQQSVDDFLVWKRFLHANLTNIQVTLQTFSLEAIREAIELATPMFEGRRRINLSFALAVSERYARIWHCSPVPGHFHKSLLSYDDLVHCVLGESIGARPKQVFIGAFLEAAVFPCTQDDAIDFRQFMTALIWMSNCSSIWGPAMHAFLETPQDPGVMKWASVRSKVLFAYLCSHKALKDDVCRDDVLHLFGESFADDWDILFLDEDTLSTSVSTECPVAFEEPTKQRYQLECFRDTIVRALCTPESIVEEPSLLGSDDDKILSQKRAAYRLTEASFNQIDARFSTSYYEGGSFFLSDAETVYIQEVLVPLERKESVASVVGIDPDDAV